MALKRYELYDFDRLEGTFTAKELQEKIGVNPRTMLSYYVYNGFRYKRRYTFVVAADEPEEISKRPAWFSDWSQEWEAVRQRLLGRYGDERRK